MAKKKKSHYHADMLSVEEAREKILHEFNSLDEVRISLNDSLSCVISKDIISNISVPPWNNSAMDGYAIILEDVKNASDKNIIYLDVIEKIAAGELPEKKIISGQSARIMTGAPIPEGSNAVVPFEDTDELSSTSSDLIGIKINVENFENIRKKGEDISKGDLIIKKGVEITPAVVGVLASIGISTIDVFRRPKIGILSTGNELIEPGQSIKDGKIYNSNTFTISSLTKSFGANPVTQAHSLDTIEDLEKKLNNFEDVDLIVTSAGVSKSFSRLAALSASVFNSSEAVFICAN